MTKSVLSRLVHRIVAGSSISGLLYLGFIGAPFGCATPEVTLRNPLIGGGALVPSRIAKTHGWAESNSGLPPGSMTDQAVLDAVDVQQVCATVTLHELMPIDLNAARINFEASPGPTVVPTVAAEQPVVQTFNGLVAQRTQTGTREECTYRNGQSVCDTRPIYSTTMVPGPVQVFATRGRLCVPNNKVVTVDTRKVTLNISIPTAAPGSGFMGIGSGSKDIDFTWGLEK